MEFFPATHLFGATQKVHPMKTFLYLLIAALPMLAGCHKHQLQSATSKPLAPLDSSAVVKIEMKQSGFGVEPPGACPNIDVTIDFIQSTSSCVVSYFYPVKKTSTYSLSKKEMADVLKLMNVSDLEKLKESYETPIMDLPSASTKIYTAKKTYSIYDYGMEGDPLLQQLYKIVYRKS